MSQRSAECTSSRTSDRTCVHSRKWWRRTHFHNKQRTPPVLWEQLHPPPPPRRWEQRSRSRSRSRLWQALAQVPRLQLLSLLVLQRAALSLVPPPPPRPVPLSVAQEGRQRPVEWKQRCEVLRRALEHPLQWWGAVGEQNAGEYHRTHTWAVAAEGLLLGSVWRGAGCTHGSQVWLWLARGQDAEGCHRNAWVVAPVARGERWAQCAVGGSLRVAAAVAAPALR